MAKRLQHRGGTTAQHSTFTGAVREVTVDTDKNTLVVHDGATAGGHPLATATNFTSTGIDDNATSTAITIDSSQNVDVAGLLTSDGLTVDGDAEVTGSGITRLNVSSSAFGYSTMSQGHIGLRGIDSIGSKTSFGHNAVIDGRFDSSIVRPKSNASGMALVFQNNGSSGNSSCFIRHEDSSGTEGNRFAINTGGNISFYEDTGTTPKFYWDASTERLGIGTSSPSHLLHLSSDTPVPLKLDRTTNADSYISYKNTTDEWTAGLDTSEGFVIANGAFMANPRLTIDSSGNVGIGTSSPSQKLDVVGSIEVSDGIYIGGTSTANKLDDYEEGTWTPEYEPATGDPFTSISYGFRYATYTKIGRQVTCLLSMRTSALTKGTASGAIVLSGLPFTVGNNTNLRAFTPVGIGTAWLVNNPSNIRSNENDTTANIQKNFENLSLQVSDMDTGGADNFMALEFTYFTD